MTLDSRLTTAGYDCDGEGGSSLTSIAEYRYDALGRRVEYIDHIRDVTTRYYYDGPSVVAEYEYPQAGGQTRLRTYMNGSQSRRTGPDVSGDFLTFRRFDVLTFPNHGLSNDL